MKLLANLFFFLQFSNESRTWKYIAQISRNKIEKYLQCLLILVCRRIWPSQLSQQTTKPTRRHVQPAKTLISLHICTVWSVFPDGMCLLQPSGNPKREELEPLPYWADVQADLSLCWSHRFYYRFCHALAQLSNFHPLLCICDKFSHSLSPYNTS